MPALTTILAIAAGAALTAKSFSDSAEQKRQNDELISKQESAQKKLESDMKAKESRDAAQADAIAQRESGRSRGASAGGRRRDTILTGPLGVPGSSGAPGIPGSGAGGGRTLLGT